MARVMAAMLALAGCTHSNVPGLSDHDTVVMNPLCLAICVSTLTVADTDTGQGSSSVGQTVSAGANASGSYNR